MNPYEVESVQTQQDRADSRYLLTVLAFSMAIAITLTVFDHIIVIVRNLERLKGKSLHSAFLLVETGVLALIIMQLILIIAAGITVNIVAAVKRMRYRESTENN